MRKRLVVKFKFVIAAAVVMGILGVGVLSFSAMDHGTMRHEGCLSLSLASSPCSALADITSCIQAHVGAARALATAVPSLSQLLGIFVVVAALWFSAKRKRDDLNAVCKHRIWLRRLTFTLARLPQRFKSWLVLHEKRDSAPASLLVPGVLPSLVG